MKIQTEVKFWESYIPPRCRKERSREAVKTISTTIQETSYIEAPVAMRSQTCLREDTADIDGKYPCGIVPDQQEHGMWIEYRWYNGNLYRRVLAYEKRCGAKGPWLIEDIIKRYSTYRHWNASADSRMASHAVRSELHNYLLIDGDVWVKCGEPIYIIATFGLGHNHASTELMNDTYYRGYSKCEFFNALQRDEAIAECKRVAIARGDTDSVSRIGEFWKIEVLIPGVVKAPKHSPVALDGFDAEAEMLIQGSSSAMEAGILVMAAAFTK